jgi:3-oxoacyl-[acyl-carrier-protein] synthase III
VEQGRIGPGSLVLMVAFGAGFTWAANVVRM